MRKNDIETKFQKKFNNVKQGSMALFHFLKDKELRYNLIFEILIIYMFQKKYSSDRAVKDFFREVVIGTKL